MATKKLYLSNVAASLAVPRRARWFNQASAEVSALTEAPAGANVAASLATPRDAQRHGMLRRWVSEPMTQAGTLDAAGAIMNSAIAVQGSGVNLAQSSFSIYVVTPADTVRGTLINEEGIAGGDGWATALTAKTETAPASFTTPVACEAGDRVVFEFGFRTVVGTGNVTGTMRYGGTAATDLAVGDTGANATSRPPWIELTGPNVSDLWADDAPGPGPEPGEIVAETFTATAIDAAGELTAPAPDGIQAGDFLLAVCTTSQTSANNGLTNITSAGWTTETFFPGNGAQQMPGTAVLWKVATGSEPASYVFTRSGFTGGDNQIVHIIRFSGVDLDDPFAAGPLNADQAATGNPVPAPALTVPVDGAMALSAHIAMFWQGTIGGDRWESDSGGTKVSDHSGNWAHMGTFLRSVDAGAHGPWNASLFTGPNQPGRGVSLALRPAAAGPGPERDVNLSTNPAAGANLADWNTAPDSAATLARVTGLVGFSRPTGAEITGPPTGSRYAQFPVGAVEPGVPVTVRGEIRRPTAGTVTAWLNWYNAAGGYVGTALSQSVTYPAGAPVVVEFTDAVPPPGAVAVGLASNTLPIGSVLTAGRISPTGGPYRDGDSPGWSWDGAQHNSTSSGVDTVPDDPEAAVRYGWGTPLPASDEFDVPGLPDPARWAVYGYDYGAGTHGTWPNPHGNGLRNSQNTEVITAGGETFLRLRGDANGDQGALASRFDQQHGRWEIRARFTRNPAVGQRPMNVLGIIWPESEIWPEDAEYDFLETPSGASAAQAWIHYPHQVHPANAQEQAIHPGGLDLTTWHNYGFEWTADGVRCYIDGEFWYEFSGIGPGAFPAGADPETFRVDDIQNMPSGHLTLQYDNFATGDPGDLPQPGTYDVAWSRVYPPAERQTGPGAYAGGNTSTGVGEPVTLTGTAGPGATGHTWSIISGPERYGEQIATTATASFTPALPGLYVIEYAATGGGTSRDRVKVVARPAAESTTRVNLGLNPQFGNVPGGGPAMWWGGDQVPVTGVPGVTTGLYADEGDCATGRFVVGDTNWHNADDRLTVSVVVIPDAATTITCGVDFYTALDGGSFIDDGARVSNSTPVACPAGVPTTIVIRDQPRNPGSNTERRPMMVPSNAVSGLVTARSAGGVPFTITALTAEYGTVAGPFFDGTHPDGTWTGTAHGSTSHTDAEFAPPVVVVEPIPARATGAAASPSPVVGARPGSATSRGGTAPTRGTTVTATAEPARGVGAAPDPAPSGVTRVELPAAAGEGIAAVASTTVTAAAAAAGSGAASAPAAAAAVTPAAAAGAGMATDPATSSVTRAEPGPAHAAGSAAATTAAAATGTASGYGTADTAAAARTGVDPASGVGTASAAPVVATIAAVDGAGVAPRPRTAGAGTSYPEPADGAGTATAAARVAATAEGAHGAGAAAAPVVSVPGVARPAPAHGAGTAPAPSPMIDMFPAAAAGSGAAPAPEVSASIRRTPAPARGAGTVVELSTAAAVPAAPAAGAGASPGASTAVTVAASGAHGTGTASATASGAAGTEAAARPAHGTGVAAAHAAAGARPDPADGAGTAAAPRVRTARPVTVTGGGSATGHPEVATREVSAVGAGGARVSTEGRPAVVTATGDGVAAASSVVAARPGPARGVGQATAHVTGAIGRPAPAYGDGTATAYPVVTVPGDRAVGSGRAAHPGVEIDGRPSAAIGTGAAAAPATAVRLGAIPAAAAGRATAGSVVTGTATTEGAGTAATPARQVTATAEAATGHGVAPDPALSASVRVELRSATGHGTTGAVAAVDAHPGHPAGRCTAHDPLLRVEARPRPARGYGLATPPPPRIDIRSGTAAANGAAAAGAKVSAVPSAAKGRGIAVPVDLFGRFVRVIPAHGVGSAPELTPSSSVRVYPDGPVATGVAEAPFPIVRVRPVPARGDGSARDVRGPSSWREPYRVRARRVGDMAGRLVTASRE